MNEQETHAEVIAEMRCAKTEFPFVYRMGEPDTPEVIDFKTKAIIEPRKINIRCVTVKELADRLEAAHERERGNITALREALKAIGGLCAGMMPTWDGSIGRIKDVTEAALAAPPRNCDKFKTSWDALKEWHEGLDTANDIVRLLDWLFAPATEKEGGIK